MSEILKSEQKTGKKCRPSFILRNEPQVRWSWLTQKTWNRGIFFIFKTLSVKNDFAFHWVSMIGLPWGETREKLGRQIGVDQVSRAHLFRLVSNVWCTTIHNEQYTTVRVCDDDDDEAVLTLHEVSK